MDEKDGGASSRRDGQDRQKFPRRSTDYFVTCPYTTLNSNVFISALHGTGAAGAAIGRPRRRGGHPAAAAEAVAAPAPAASLQQLPRSPCGPAASAAPAARKRTADTPAGWGPGGVPRGGGLTAGCHPSPPRAGRTSSTTLSPGWSAVACASPARTSAATVLCIRGGHAAAHGMAESCRSGTARGHLAPRLAVYGRLLTEHRHSLIGAGPG